MFLPPGAPQTAAPRRQTVFKFFVSISPYFQFYWHVVDHRQDLNYLHDVDAQAGPFYAANPIQADDFVDRLNDNEAMARMEGGHV